MTIAAMTGEFIRIKHPSGFWIPHQLPAGKTKHIQSFCENVNAMPTGHSSENNCPHDSVPIPLVDRN
jgi:hypothetical protein